jgi:POT family proton-dependent oligopeptide transporter
LKSSLYDQPAGLSVLFFTELWERFSYYGMRALLVLFMVAQVQSGGLGMSDASATAIYGLYTASVYLAALPGGWLGDAILGSRRAVWYGGLVIMLGHFTLAIPAPWSFYPGLALVVLGTGLLKPNVSAMVGQLYAPTAHAQRDSGFILFYMGINIGAMLGPLVCSALGESDCGWHAGFAAAGIGMALGLIWYRLGIGNLSMVSSAPRISAQSKQILLLMLPAALVIALGIAAAPSPVIMVRYAGWILLAVFFAYLARLLWFSSLNGVERRHVLGLAILCLASAVFWSGFEQAGSSMNLFAERHTDRMIFNWEIPAGWFQSLNPVFIILLAPLYSSMWIMLARHNLNPEAPLKFAMGLLILAVGFGLMVIAADMVVSGEHHVAARWLIGTYLLHTTAELMLSPVGLSAMSRYAPRGMTARMMGMWFMTFALGNLLAGIFASASGAGGSLDLPALYTRIVIISILSGVLMLLAAPGIKRLLAAR